MTTGTPLYFNGTNAGQWQSLTGDLTPFAGQTISYVLAGIHQQTPIGHFDLYLTNAAIQTADGRTLPILTGQSASVSNVQSSTELTPVTDAKVSTNFYLDDHLGTTQMELASGGWPVWQGQFTPFGQEIVGGNTTNYFGQQPSDGTAMRFKFTGKERDAESGLDYFGARYYASNMGRWMSPDWADKPEDVPYASMDNPQSLNLYGYVYNNPLSRADADGHWPSWDNVKTALDVASFIPVVGDVASAASGAISLAQGHYGEAALSFAAAIPIAGVLAEGGKAIKLTREAGIAINRARGLAGEAKVGEEILAEGGKILGSHVGVQTEKGLRVVDKLVSKDAKLGAVEVKTGGATRTAAQVAKDESMAEKGERS